MASSFSNSGFAAKACLATAAVLIAKEITSYTNLVHEFRRVLLFCNFICVFPFLCEWEFALKLHQRTTAAFLVAAQPETRDENITCNRRLSTAKKASGCRRTVYSRTEMG